MIAVVIKPLTKVHIEQVKAIERSCFPQPWDDKVFDSLARWHGRIILNRGKIVCMDVAEEDNTTVGYVVWEEDRVNLKGRIMNIAVREVSRRKGIGKLLLTHALQSQKDNGMMICELEVRENNLPARFLYESVKMNVLGREPAYYDTEDAIIYSIEL